MSIVDKVRAILDELDILTADEIAERFRNIGIKGLRMQGSICPIANYVKFLLPQVEDFYTCGSFSIWSVNGVSMADERGYGGGVMDFINKFDRKTYEDLIA